MSCEAKIDDEQSDDLDDSSVCLQISDITKSLKSINLPTLLCLIRNNQ